MAVLGRLLVSSAERLDLPDFLSLDSYTQGDFKYLMRSFVGGETPYILKGFDVIDPEAAIGTQNISIRVADSVAYYPGSLAGPFFHGLEEGNAQASPLIPELRKNATNYVYLTFTTTDAAQDTRAFWDLDKEAGVGGEFTQDVNTETVLDVAVNVSVSAFPANTIPVCIVEVGANFVTSITDSRDLMFRLATGGLNPDPLAKYQFRSEPTAGFERDEPNTTMSSALDPNAFQGGDKNIQSLKEWMDVVMTKLLELGGTTFWYEDTTTFSIVNIFKDALATSIKSKGEWQSSDVTPGLLTWTEDIVVESVSDKKTILIRDGNDTLLNDQVLYLEQIRDENINTGSVSVDWLNGLNYVNGTLGSFESLTKGDWIKKASDPDYLYLRVEEFYAAANLGGGVTSPANALSIKLSDTYAGTSGPEQGLYTKGVYLNTDVTVGDRDDAALTTAGGNMYWLAMRSDTIMGVSDITTTTLTIDITGHDGVQAQCTQVAHGLLDKQRVTIAGSTNFDGTYQIEVVDADNFYIQISGGPHADELTQSAYYATVTTTTTSTVDGLQLESANHGFETDQKAIVTNTTNYNGTFDIFVTSDTTFTIPVPSGIANETSGSATSVNIYVRTDLGPTKLSQGENKQIGEVESENIMSFIGMDNASQTYPVYSILPTYNTLNSQHNFNSDITDNVTQRLSKLTAMMADKAQDKTISENADYDAVVNTTNGSAQDITFTGSQSMTVTMPSSDNNGTVTMTGTLSLLQNQAAYYTMDRNASYSIAGLGALSVDLITDIPVDENIKIFAYRLGTTDIFLWNGDRVEVGSLPSPAYQALIARQDRDLKLVEGGTWDWNLAGNTLTWDANAFIQLPGVTSISNQVDAGNVMLTADEQVAYVTVNRVSAGAASLSISTSSISALTPTDSTVIIARRVQGEVIVGSDSFLLKDGESQTLDASASDQTLSYIGAPDEADSTPAYTSNIRGVANEDLTARIGALTDAMGDFQEDRSTYLRSEEPLQWTGTQLEFTQDIDLEIINTKSGTTTVHTVQVADSPITLAAGESAWVEIDRSAASENLTVNKSGTLAVPAQVQGDKDVFILFKRVDNVTTSTAELFVPLNNQIFTEGQSARLGSGGGGTGIVKADFHDPTSTTLPVGATVTIDNVSGVDGDLVLFSNLTVGANKIYELSGVGVAIAWTAKTKFDGQEDPTDGDLVIIRKGDGFAESIGKFDGTDWKFNEVVRYFTGADFWEVSSLKTTAIVNNTTADIFSVSLTGSENFIVNYSISRGTGKETGQVYITSDGTSVSNSVTNTFIGDSGVDLVTDISVGDIRLRYTSDNSGPAGTIKYFVMRWSNSPGGPSGIPNYNTGTGSSVPAAGNIGEIQFHGGGGVLDADSNLVWDSAESAIDMNGLSIKALSSGITINDNQAAPDVIISYVAASNKFTVIEYSVEKSTGTIVGRLMIPTDGTTMSFNNDFVENGTTGVTIDAVLTGANIEVRYTSTSTGGTGTFKYSHRQWD